MAGKECRGRHASNIFTAAALTAIAAALIAIAALLAVSFAIHSGSNGAAPVQAIPNNSNHANSRSIDLSSIYEQVYPSNGFNLPVKWNGVVKQLAEDNALNLSFLAASLGNANNTLTIAELKILNGTSTANVSLNSSDGLFALYALWALGINNRNPIIDNGPITGVGNPYELASTGGYGPLGHLSLGNLSIISLNGSEQGMAEEIASNVYRPCCDNPAMLPDCNHGAAQLGIIELMASQGSNAAQIYSALKDFNSFYFPQQYFEDAVYFNITQNKTWNEMPANQVLGYNFSSYSGYSNVNQYLINANALQSATGGSSSACGA